MENTCYEIQKKILKQKHTSEVINWEINHNQQQTTTLLKSILIQKHLYIQRLFYAEMFTVDQIKNPLEQAAFISNGEEVSNNFACLILPDDFSKGPMKAFLNNLLDSLESFLPAFYKLNPSKLPRGAFASDPSKILLRCVFPSLFAYCWAEEPAISYAHNLVTWFGEIYRENINFIQNFNTHWMAHAMRGFFTALNLVPFISKAIRPHFFRFVQLENKDVQNDVSTLIAFSIDIMQSMHENFSQLPSVLNLFFSELFAIIQNSDQKILVKFLFFDLLIAPCFENPVLCSVSDVQLPEDDYILFNNIYLVFKARFNSFHKNELDTINKIKNMTIFEKFDPYIIMDDIINQKAARNLPLLREFCDIVQCAHQPLLITTHSLSLLFRFVASLQHTAMLPKSIDRSISNVFQEALADKLEIMPDLYFWFPCFSLTYLNIPKTCFIKNRNNSSLYKLLSSNSLRISPLDDDFTDALKNAYLTTNLTTDPEIRTEIHWLLANTASTDYVSDIREELDQNHIENNQKRARSLKLLKYSKQIQTEINLIPNGPLRSLANKLLKKFNERYPDVNIRSNAFLTKAPQVLEEFCGKSFKIVGSYLAESIVVAITPCIKCPRCQKTESFKITEEITLLRSIVPAPILSSSLYSIAEKIVPDLIMLMEYANIEKIENPFYLTYSEPFIRNPEKFARNLSSLLLSLPTPLLQLVFNDKDIEILNSFTSELANRNL